MAIPAKSSLPILILAAGQSARMRGADKLLEDVEGQPLLRRQAVIARAATEGPVLVTLPPPPHARWSCLSGLAVSCLTVPDAADGMSASLRRGIAALQDHPAVMILLADLPDLTAQDLASVLATVDPESDTRVWRGATEDDRPGHPLVIAQPLFAAFKALAGDNGGRDILASQQHNTRTIPLPGQRALSDLDTPEDWARWRREKRIAKT